MDNVLALGLVIVLLLRVAPYLLGRLSPALRHRLRNQMLRFQALLDVAGGSLMAILVGWLIAQRAWLPAMLLAAISIPTWTGLVAGLRHLARTPR